MEVFRATIFTAISLFSSFSHANLIVNGSFENGPHFFAGVGPGVGSNGSTALPGWVVTDGTVIVIQSDAFPSPDGTNWPAADGVNSIQVKGSGQQATIIQHITGLSIGQKYELRFSMSGNPVTGGDSVGSADAIKDLLVTIDGRSQVFSFDVTPYHTLGFPIFDMGWKEYTFQFVSDATLTDVSFKTLDPQQSTRGAVIDNVRLEALSNTVPEPTSFVLCVVGALICGVRQRMRRLC